MPEINNNISSETKIVFTLKGFVATIISILTIFASFYFMVIDPRIEKAEQHGQNLLNEYKINNDNQFNHLKELIEKDHSFFKQGIKSALDASKANAERFRDTNQAVQATPNSGGGDSSNNDNI